MNGLRITWEAVVKFVGSRADSLLSIKYTVGRNCLQKYDGCSTSSAGMGALPAGANQIRTQGLAGRLW